jgi:hypothetical protein
MSLGECATAAEANDCVRWACEFWQAVQPHSNGTVYVNYPGQDDEGPERIRSAYGPEKYQLLVALKNKYDPTNLFRLKSEYKADPMNPADSLRMQLSSGAAMLPALCLRAIGSVPR